MFSPFFLSFSELFCYPADYAVKPLRAFLAIPAAKLRTKKGTVPQRVPFLTTCGFPQSTAYYRETLSQIIKKCQKNACLYAQWLRIHWYLLTQTAILNNVCPGSGFALTGTCPSVWSSLTGICFTHTRPNTFSWRQERTKINYSVILKQYLVCCQKLHTISSVPKNNS